MKRQPFQPRFPGFTAQGSLYKTSGTYRTGLAFDPVRGGVQLAQNDCFSNCMDDCIGGPLTTAQCSASCHRRCSPAPPPPPPQPSGPFCHGFYCRDNSYVCTAWGCCPEGAVRDPTGQWTPGQFPYPDPSGQYMECEWQYSGCINTGYPLHCDDTNGCCPAGWNCCIDSNGNFGGCCPAEVNGLPVQCSFVQGQGYCTIL